MPVEAVKGFRSFYYGPRQTSALSAKSLARNMSREVTSKVNGEEWISSAAAAVSGLNTLFKGST